MMASLLALSFALAVPSQSYAQDPAQDVDEIIVTGERGFTGTKTDTPLTDIPQSISVIDATEIFERAAQDFQDVFRYSAGASVGDSDDSRFDNVQVRGFSTSLFVDGVLQRPSTTGVNFIKVENYGFESVELLRGPSSVLYGTGGPGGILNAISKRPQAEFGGEIAIDVGNDNRVQGKVDVTGALSDTVSARFVGLIRDAESQWGTPDDRLLINPSITWAPTDRTELTLIGLYQDNAQGSLGYLPIPFSRDAPTPTLTLDRDFYQGDLDSGFSGLDSDVLSLTGIFEHKFNDNLRLRNATRYSDGSTNYQEVFTFGFILDSVGNVYDRTNLSAFPANEPYLLERSAFTSFEDYKVFNSDTNIGYDFAFGDIENSILVGVDYLSIKTEEREGFAGFLPPADTVELFNPNADFTFNVNVPVTFGNDTNISQLGFYVQNQITVFDRLEVILGLRHDEISSESRFLGLGNFADDFPDQGNTSYRAGLVYEIFDGFSPYVSYAESFSPVPGTDGNGDAFDPQQGEQVEVGLKWEPAAGVFMSAAYFDVEENNFVSAPGGDPNTFFQDGAIGTTGIELELRAALPGDLELTAAYTNFDSKVTEDAPQSGLVAGTRTPGIADTFASVWPVKSFDLFGDWDARAGGGVRYVGDKLDGNIVTPSATLADATMSVFNDDWRVSFNVSNLFDTEYYGQCFDSGVGTCTAGVNRTYVAEIAKKF